MRIKLDKITYQKLKLKDKNKNKIKILQNYQEQKLEIKRISTEVEISINKRTTLKS